MCCLNQLSWASWPSTSNLWQKVGRIGPWTQHAHSILVWSWSKHTKHSDLVALTAFVDYTGSHTHHNHRIKLHHQITRSIATEFKVLTRTSRVFPKYFRDKNNITFFLYFEKGLLFLNLLSLLYLLWALYLSAARTLVTGKVFNWWLVELPMWLTDGFSVTFFGRWRGQCAYTLIPVWLTCGSRTQ